MTTYTNPKWPGWLKVWVYGMDHHGQPLEPGQLRDACRLDQRTLSRSLTTARKLNLITADSNARCVKAVRPW
jgi:hypothetical protein